MRLTRLQRAAILAGDYSALKYPYDEAKPANGKPDWGVGDTHPVLTSTTKPTWDPGTRTMLPPVKTVLLEIEITEVREAPRTKRGEKGGWLARFDVTDRRQGRRLLRASPPVLAVEQAKEDRLRPPTETELEAAEEESAYTTNPGTAIDPLDVVPRGEDIPRDAAAMHRKGEQQRRDDSRQGLSLDRQLRSLLQDASDGRKDDDERIRNRKRKIQREIELLARDLKEAA